LVINRRRPAPSSAIDRPDAMTASGVAENSGSEWTNRIRI
jgi:hypothetical protein